MGDKRRPPDDTSEAAVSTARDRLTKLCECERVVSCEEILAHGRINRGVAEADGNASSSDEVDEILEAEYRRLNDVLGLPVDTYSLTRISPNLPTCVKYGVRSGLTNQSMQKFSPLSRGLQGPAVAIAAFATTALVKARCWNELIIDQIVDDGDTYYCESYERLRTDDRRSLTVLDLNRDLVVQKTHRVHVKIDEPLYAGTFRSKNPTNLHLAKALELFFKRHDAGVLTSPVLNIAVWKDAKYFNIFDGQGRRDNLLPTDDPASGSAKLILVPDINGVLFVIHEKSAVGNENFVIYGLSVMGIDRLPLVEDDPEEPEKSIGAPKRRPSGYKLQNKFRALVQGSFHLNHALVPEELRGHAHLVVALAALIYSRLVNANKWTTAMIDLIFNQAHIYLIDLARVLEKKLDENFELKIDDVMGDVILGVYAAKIKVEVNVVPGQAKKGKATIDTGFRDFFKIMSSGILEIKKKFYAVWRDGEKYYFLDPFACDDEGFRVDPADAENVEKYNNALACVTMNSSINELIETILENTGNKEKDAFVLHGLRVLYVSTGSLPGGPRETVIYREKKTNRRPLPPRVAQPEAIDDCKTVLDMIPRPRPDAERTKDASVQYPELMRRVEEYMMKENEPTTYVENASDAGVDSKKASTNEDDTDDAGDPGEDESVERRIVQDPVGAGQKLHVTIQEDRNVEIEDVDYANVPPEEEPEPVGPPVEESESLAEARVNFISGYNIINPHRMILHGSKNCLADEFDARVRGRQGIVLALTAVAYAKIKDPTSWRNLDVDQILRVGDRAHSDVVTWIRQGSPATEDGAGGSALSETDEDTEAGGDNEEDEDAEAEDEEGEPGESKAFKGALKPAPSHLDLSMLPDKIKLAENEVRFKSRSSVVEGDADPLANLGEALEQYFGKYSEVILENKRLAYGIWRQDDKYFLLNPYGADEEGWRLRDYPASLVVTDTINELTDLLHGVLEFNDTAFNLHFIGIESVQPQNKYIAPLPVQVPEGDGAGKYRTRFLPVTDEDLFVPRSESESQVETTAEEAPKGETDEEEEEGEDEEGETDDEGDARGTDEDEAEDKETEEESPEPERQLEDPLLEVEEQERPDAPEELNLSLLTGSVKIDEDAVADPEARETLLYERLKYSHPPPYVLPPKRVLCVLLEAKKASKSVHSLVSRFSIDSKLAVKAATDLPTGKEADVTAVVSVVPGDGEKPSKMIKLPPKKYLFSRIPPTGFTPLRAINDKFIQDEELDRAREDECRKGKAEGLPDEFELRRIPEDPVGVRIMPEIIPLGPTIKTPTPRRRPKPCADRPKNRKCRLSAAEREDAVLRRILCNTEDVLFDVIFPNGGKRLVVSERADTNEKRSAVEESQGFGTSGLRAKSPEERSRDEETIPETVGFVETEGNVGIIEGNMRLENRSQTEDCHFRSCFFAAILCILAKVRLDVDTFRGSILDQFVLASEKIIRRTGKLRYKPLRWIHNIVIAGAKCNVIMKQAVYADPESCETDALLPMLETYLTHTKTGILVFANASYAFWSANGKYYMFDPYACDGRGRASDDGSACLLEFCELEEMANRLRENNGTPPEDPYRIYSLSIAHMESTKRRKRSRRKRKRCSKKISEESVREEPLEEGEESDEAFGPKHESSLVEIREWVTEDENSANKFDPTLPGFAAVKNLEASALEVAVVENDITRPILAPFRKLKGGKEKARDGRDPQDPPRRKPYDRKFGEQTCLGEPIDLCVIAWSLVKDPTLWGVRTIRGIYEAARELALDSLLAARDSTVVEMTDGLLTEFSIGNYSFRAVFAPLRGGTLYAMEGWNLAMSLKKILEVPIYSGAILVCGKAHIGLMKRGANHYAWWAVPRTKNLRIVTSEILEDFLKLVVRAIGEREEREFVLRIVTISYARKSDPDCSDMAGLHETAVPSTSLAQIHRKASPPYDLDAIFRPSVPNEKPLFISGTVALSNRDSVTEPRVKRCYFVALLSVMVKRDIIQSPMPGMIDKVIEVAENLYREFEAPKYHTEHILRNVTVMNRIFDFRDCASTLHSLKENPHTGKTDFYVVVRKELRRHLKDHTDGIIQFTNCCYGFWYSRSTRACYYLDPYPCDSRGRRVGTGGNACLCIFPSICQMARHMCTNRLEETTGFFVHRVHVESINVPPFEKFQEDPMWVYLDYHWSFDHSPGVAASGGKKTKRRRTKRVIDEDDHRLCEESEQDRAPEREEPPRKPSWNHYAIEVPNLIYSIWGTLGCYDSRFGDRAGRNQAAICVAILAMQYLCHPSKWGAAILDSAVMCGDSYYTESLKSASRRGSRYPNRFNLQACFRVFPHVWSIEFCASMCGVLYGGRGRPNLATALKLAVEESQSLVVECGKVTVAVLSAEDGFYVADPCWTGPPLFAKNHGAVYALRCRNINSLVYAITKIFNTNQRLEFRIDPVMFTFSQEICKFADARGKSTKKILVDPLGSEPGFAAGPDTPLSGAVAVPDEDGYLSYRRNVERGILHGGELEDPPIPSPVPWMEEDNVNNSLLSTTWHLNVGRAVPKRRSVPPFETLSIERVSKECSGSKIDARETRKTHSISDKIQLCDEYPRTIDLAAGRYVAKSTKILTRRKSPQAIASTQPVEGVTRRSFLLESSRKEFRKWNKRMADEAFKTYRHRAILDPEEETDVESHPAASAGDDDKTGDRETPPDDQPVIDEGED